MKELIDILKESRDFWFEESNYWKNQYKELLDYIKNNLTKKEI